MATFRYKAVAGDGKLVDGELEAPDAKSAISQLQATGHLPISARPKSEQIDPARLVRRIRAWRERIAPRDVTAVTRELATLLNAGIPIDTSLRTLARHAREGRLKRVLKAVHGDVQSGKSLSASLQEHPEVFGSLYVNLVRAGEASGALGLVMQRLADYREQTDAFRSSIASALAYPVILVCVALTSLFVLTVFVIPRFIPLFADASAALPLLTQIVFWTAEHLRSFWWVPLGLAITAKAAADRWLAMPGNRRRFDRRMLKVPVAGELVLLAETARFCRTLATLVRNGLPLLTSLKLARQVLRNEVLRAAADACIAAVHSGGRLAATLQRENIFPSLATELIMIGEESGQLEEMLEKAAETFEAQVQRKLEQLLTLLEPVLILGLGAVIAVVIVAILMAMLGLNELVV